MAAYIGLDLEFGTWTDGLTNGKGDAYSNYYLAQPFLDLLKTGTIPESVVDGKVRNI